MQSMYAFIGDTDANIIEDIVGDLWGLNVLGVLPLYYDKDKNKHYALEIIDGMCGIEKMRFYFDIPDDGIVTFKDEQWRVKMRKN
jgi:hypothetical protein